MANPYLGVRLIMIFIADRARPIDMYSTVDLAYWPSRSILASKCSLADSSKSFRNTFLLPGCYLKTLLLA